MGSIILISLALISICVLLMGIRVFFTKNGRFPSSHVGDSPELKKRGIHCAKKQDVEERRKQRHFDFSDL